MARSVYSDIAFCHAMVNRNLFKKSGNLNFVEIQYFITYRVSFISCKSYGTLYKICSAHLEYFMQINL